MLGAILEINQVNYGSTGNIMLDIAEVARQEGLTVYTACPDSRLNRRKQLENHIVIGNMIGHKLSRILAWATGRFDTFSAFSTWNFLRKIKKLNITKIHLHNLHGSYLNLPMLFRYISKHEIEVIWTLHDCWAFTGHCPYYDYVECDRWKQQCHNCLQPAGLRDCSGQLWRLKKKYFTSVKKMTVVTPSRWLLEEVKQSFLGKYPGRVIHNGINLELFHKQESDFRARYQIEQKYIVLGVALNWERRKGLESLLYLEKHLNPSLYKIVIVGTDDEVDQILPDTVISIHRTHNQTELAEIYSVANVFVNPTLEENYPTVNMEAIACGTPVVSYRTGGSLEMVLPDAGCGVEKGNMCRLLDQVIAVCENAPYTEEMCLQHAKSFDRNQTFRKYVALYRNDIP